MSMSDGAEWRTIPGFPEYEVSDDGRVRSNTWRMKGKEMKQAFRGPYPYVTFPGKKKRDVHTLVALAFLGPRPAGMHVCHQDDDQTNNHVSNLRYDTPKQNTADAIRNRKKHAWAPGESPSVKLSPEQVLDIVARLDAGERPVDLAAEFGLQRSAITYISNGKTWGWLTGRGPASTQQ